MRKLALALLLYAIAVVTIALLYRSGVVLAGLLVVYAILAWRLDPHPEDGFTLVGGAVFGPAAEAVAVGQGAWSYAHPDFLGIPIWLPVGWALACLLLKRLSEAVREILAERKKRRLNAGLSSAVPAGTILSEREEHHADTRCRGRSADR